MDDFFPFTIYMIWLIFIGFIVIIFIFYYRLSSSVKRIFEAQALKRGGTVGGSFMNRTLTFSYREYDFTVSEYPGSKNQPAYTRVVTYVNKIPEQKVKIYGESWASEIGKKLGMQDIQLGSSEFDDKFMIKGNDSYFVINLLNYRVQDKLLAIRKYKPVVTIKNTQLMVNVPRVLRSEVAYDHLIEAAFVIVDRLEEI